MTKISSIRSQIPFLFPVILLLISACVIGCIATNQQTSSIDYDNLTPEDIPMLMEEILTPSNMEIQRKALDTVELICRQDGPSVFLDFLSDGDPEIRSNVLIVLGFIVRKGTLQLEREPDLLPSIINLLDDENSEVVANACNALADIAGAEVRDYESEGGVPGEHTDILGDLTEGLISELIPLLNNNNGNVRVVAANLLNTIGHDSIDAVPALLEMLVDEDYLVRLAAAIAVARISPETEEPIPVLIEGVETGNTPTPAGEERRRQPNLGYYTMFHIEVKCAFALKLIGEPAAVAIPSLVKLFESEEFSIRADIPEVIASIDPSGETSVPILIELLGDENPQVQRHAALTLRYIGPPAVDSLPVLREMQERRGEFTPEVRAEVDAAIESIETGVW